MLDYVQVKYNNNTLYHTDTNYNNTQVLDYLKSNLARSNLTGVPTGANSSIKKGLTQLGNEFIISGPCTGEITSQRTEHFNT